MTNEETKEIELEEPGDQLLNLPEDIPEKEWNAFVFECQNRVTEVESSSEAMCWDRWGLGKWIIEWCSENDARKRFYGQNLRARLAWQCGFRSVAGVKILSQCCTVANKYKTEADVRHELNMQKATHGRITWEMFRSGLPKIKDSEMTDEEKLIAMCTKLEAVTSEMQNYVYQNHQMNGDYEEIVQGTLTKCLEILVPTSNLLDVPAHRRKEHLKLNPPEVPE